MDMINQKSIKMITLQRLLNSLIPHLINWVQHNQPSTPAVDAMLGFQQSQAVQKLDPAEPPVKTDDNEHSLLIDTIDLNMSNNQIRLVFKAQEQVFAISFTHFTLQQWLALQLAKLVDQT